MNKKLMEIKDFACDDVIECLNIYEKTQEKKLRLILNYLRDKYNNMPYIIMFNPSEFSIAFMDCGSDGWNKWKVILQDFWNISKELNFDDFRFDVVCLNAL